jgi:hypothetical protein
MHAPSIFYTARAASDHVLFARRCAGKPAKRREECLVRRRKYMALGGNYIFYTVKSVQVHLLSTSLRHVNVKLA